MTLEIEVASLTSATNLLRTAVAQNRSSGNCAMVAG